jgi:hypothetical protein
LFDAWESQALFSFCIYSVCSLIQASNCRVNSEVDRGLDCDCICPECGRNLVARKGLLREHHFAHAVYVNNDYCGVGFESQLHRYAKQIIEEAGYLVVPSFVAHLPPPNYDKYINIPGETIKFQRVEVEEKFVVGNRIIDVVGYHANGRLLIEIVVTHRVNGSKLRQVRAADEALLEIVIPKNILFSPSKEGADSLKSLILDMNDFKRWVIHPRGAKALRALAKSLVDATKVGYDLESTQRGSSPESNLSEPNKISANNHLPDRSKCTDSLQYVIKLHEFLVGANYDQATRNRIIKALILGGYITSNDILLAKSIGIEFL